MEFPLFSYAIFFLFLLISCVLYKTYSRVSTSNLPPGKLGLPFIGETLEFLSDGWKGRPEKFINDRMARFSSQAFKTSLFGESTIVVCGAEGNKFLFTNESKLVTPWWPSSVNKIFPSPSADELSVTHEGKKLRKVFLSAIKPESYNKFVSIMDLIAQRHFAASWESEKQVQVYSLAKRYTFWLACRLFLSISEPEEVAKLADPFDSLASGIISLPFDFPGNSFNRAIKASKIIQKQLLEIIKLRKIDLAENKPLPTQDILSHMLLFTDENGKYMSEKSIVNKILALLIGGHDTASASITFIVKCLAELPHVYDEVYNEQMDILKSKRSGELLNWEDIQKMKYSWNVACEVMRLAPPLQGAFREAIKDFHFAGYSIPKGWKLYWSANTTHRNPKYFPEPEKFDPLRYDGKGAEAYTYVAFGGGPRMCPGKEYARLEILVFIHNIVKRFKWEKLLPNEPIIVNPLPMPANGLPISLYPHN